MANSSSPAAFPNGPVTPLKETVVPASDPLGGFPAAFWLLNTIEACERLAFYLVWPVVGIYIAQKDDPGGLHRSQEEKGVLILWFSIIQAILPIVSGGYADRYGFKLSLTFSLVLSALGYALMAAQHSFLPFSIGIVMVGIGASFFKPALQGALSRLLTREQSSLGWGIFYWVVNIGALLGHWISPFILLIPHEPQAYLNLFWLCSGSCILALALLLFLFRDIPTGAAKNVHPLLVLWNTAKNIAEPRLLSWLIIMSCFWMMMYQLWDSQPNFIQDWIDRASLAHIWPLTFWAETGDDGIARVPQQILVSLNSVLIVIFVVPVSHFVRKLRSLTAMLGGMFVVTIGMFIAGSTQTAWILLVGISFFSLGEMLVGPKKSEYLALIAPPGKKALYLGYVMIPTGIGRGLGNWLSGWLYGEVGEKAPLSLRYLMENTSFGEGKQWDGRMKSLESASGVKLTEAFETLQETTNLSANDATQLLWNTYHPQYHFWLPFVAVGILATIALAIYGQMAKKWADMNA